MLMIKYRVYHWFLSADFRLGVIDLNKMINKIRNMGPKYFVKARIFIDDFPDNATKYVPLVMNTPVQIIHIKGYAYFSVDL